ncbi:hypothetical protein B6U81_02405 [Thermoplasmatales archaeon ex4484_30]|nr:MAG: hypothetical protein B6U81_02405 [Thermoplasmatales archaeon ex4484_30]
MLFPSEMSKVSILIHKGDSPKLIKALHESGLVEIEKVSYKDVSEGKMHPEVATLANYELRLSRIIEILKSYWKEERRRFSFRKGEKKKVRKRETEDIINDAEKILSEIEESVLQKEREINEIEGKIENLEEKLRKLEYVSMFDIDISWLGKSKYLIVKFGICTDLESLKVDKEVHFYSKRIGKKKENLWAVLIVAPLSLEEKLARIKNFEEIFIEGEGMAKELLKELKKEIREEEEKKKSIESELANIYKKRKIDLFAIREEIQIEKERREIYNKFGETNYTYLIEGWCLAEDSEKVKEIVEDITGRNAVISVEKAKRNPDSPPIHLKNPKWAKPFETFLELFALPKYNEVNPTLFLGISFIIFFSVMLGDAGYGVVIFILSLIAYIKFKESHFIRTWSFLGIWLGFGNIITGFIFNSFFGDFIPRFIYGNPEKLLYNFNFLGISLPIDAIHKPVLILAIALTLGLAHLNLGFILGVYQNAARGHIRKIFGEQIPWFLLEIGGGMLIGEALLDLWQLNIVMKAIAILFTIIGIISLFRRAGALGFFELTGFLGDWLSYARLLALGLATAGMALAFNIVAQLIPSIVPYIGIILVPIILIFAHFANLLIQSLGAAIHALRLQYVEFFNRFYEGGGKKFIPFRVSRKYTEEIK